MYTAKLISKNEVNGVVTLEVEFTNGTKTLLETVSPQDKYGYQRWVAARIQSLNTLEELITEDNLDKEVEKITAPTDTEAEVAFQDWLKSFIRLQQVQTLIDLSVVVETNPKVVSLRNRVKDGLKVEYIDRL